MNHLLPLRVMGDTIHTATGIEVCVIDPDGRLSPTDAERLARLFAAAPGLYEALLAMVAWAEKVNEHSNDGGLLGAEYNAACDALGKADPMREVKP